MSRDHVYKRKETKLASLDGKVACELSKHLYGVDQWWVLLLLLAWELTCLPPWVAKEEMGTLLLASETPVPIPR